MSWEKEVAEINHRQALARQMGGPEGIERQHKRGKLTVRERIDRLVDDKSWQEF
jgi:acetyl-CoA carboxylase carboxyltransferase component